MVVTAESQAAAWYISHEELLRRPAETGQAIDPNNPAEVDDAISVSYVGDNVYRAAVHVADLGLLNPRSLLLQTARNKGWSRYYSDSDDVSENCDPMIPATLSKYGLSLNIDHHGLGAPATTIGFYYDASLRRVLDVDVYKSRLVDCESLSYEQHAWRFKQGDPQALAVVGLATVLNQDISSPSEFSSQSRARDCVGEFMIMANRIIAQEMQKHAIPWLFRNHQYRVPGSLRDFDGSSTQQAQADLFTTLGLASYSTTPEIHQGLNLMPYCHFTSPLRRFADLANHATLHAVLSGRELPYDKEQLDEVAEDLNQMLIGHVRAEATSEAA